MKPFLKRKYRFFGKCNICGEKRRTKIFSIGEQNLVKCVNCGLSYFDNQRIDVNTLYNKDYYKNNESNSTANYSDYANQEKVIKNKFKFAYSYI